MRSTVKYIILLICLFSLSVSYRMYQSMKLQVEVIQEFNSKSYTDQTLSKVLEMDYSFPNITVTTLPMSDIVAKYFFLSKDFDSALSILDKDNSKSNPYLYTREILKAEIFAELNVADSALYYSKIAFTNMPNNPYYFQFMSKYMNKLGYKDSIVEYYKLIPDQSQLSNYQTILAFFANDNNSDNTFIKQLAKKARSTFQSENTIQVLSDYVLYGSDNVRTAVKLAENAALLSKDSKYEEVSKLYIEAASLNPGDYTYFENAGYTLGLLGKHEEAIPYLSQVVDSLNPGTGKSEFLMGYSYGQLGQNELACKYLRKSIKLNFQPAYQEFNKVCK